MNETHTSVTEPPMRADRELDVRGLSCPLPILRTKKALSEMHSGQTIRVVATDPGSVRDFDAFARQTGNSLLASTRTEDAYEFLLRRR